MWNPEDYAQNSDAQLRWARSLMQDLNLHDYPSILDLGCGDGKITADFAASCPQNRIVGVDSSQEMIAYATQQYPSEKYPNLSFICLDGRSLNFAQEFDLVFSNATLHWIDNHQAVLRGINAALKAEGRLIISCGGEGNAAQILETFAHLTTADSWREYFSNFKCPYFFYGLQDYQTWLQESGFAIKRLELVPKDMTHQEGAGLAGWIRTTWIPYIKCVPETFRTDFIDQFVELYLAQYPVDNRGLTHVSMVRLEVDARLTSQKSN